jgi:hypothetical protein
MFDEIYRAVTAGYQDGRPLWMAKPGESIFCTVSKKEVESKSEKEIQEIFRGRHIVIYNEFEPAFSFDERGLKTLGDLHKTVTVQGM